MKKNNKLIILSICSVLVIALAIVLIVVLSQKKTSNQYDVNVHFNKKDIEDWDNVNNKYHVVDDDTVDYTTGDYDGSKTNDKMIRDFIENHSSNIVNNLINGFVDYLHFCYPMYDNLDIHFSIENMIIKKIKITWIGDYDHLDEMWCDQYLCINEMFRKYEGGSINYAYININFKNPYGFDAINLKIGDGPVEKVNNVSLYFSEVDFPNFTFPPLLP